MTHLEAVFYGLGRLPDAARPAILEKHYLRRMPPISHYFVAWCGDKVVAVSTFGIPASRHLQMSLCPTNPDAVVELNRLWVDDDMPRNTASEFLAICLRRLPPLLVASYADTTAGHAGYVYRAANFFYAGWTDMERKTPRFDYVPRNGKHSRDAFRSGDFDRVRRLPKVKYWTATGNKKEKRAHIKASGWPSLDWKALPPPTLTPPSI